VASENYIFVHPWLINSFPGYFCTGDIVEVREDRQCHVIARRKETIKLGNGEFVQPVKLEAIFSKSPWVKTIYVHADGLRTDLVCERRKKGGKQEMEATKGNLSHT
jgi:acyl-CoA synthetase (AMP-forming)/AMP-acid ligase II